MKILFIDTVHPILVEKLKLAGHVCIDGTAMSRTEILGIVSTCDGVVIRSRMRIDREFLEASRGLKFIARAGAGMENIDSTVAKEKGIICLNAPEGNRNAVAEHALGMLLNLQKKISSSFDEIKNGKWIREENRGTELSGKTVGIIGYGNTGSSFARLLSVDESDVLNPIILPKLSAPELQLLPAPFLESAVDTAPLANLACDIFLVKDVESDQGVIPGEW